MKVLLRCVAPLAHGAFGESAGNATLCRRMPIVSLPGMPRVPCVSGNALRGVLRRIVMRDLLRAGGVSRQDLGAAQWDRLYASLVNGGHLDNSETRVDPTSIRALRESLPPLSVFGAALYSWMLPGHMSVGVLWPRCAETIAAGLVETGPETIAAEDLVTEVSHCRHVDREHQDPEVSGVTPMPTTVEAIAPGALLEGQILFAAHATPIERAAIAHGIQQIRALGGKSGSGLGAVDLVEPSVVESGPYVEWLTAAIDLGDRLRALAGTMAANPKKEKSTKKAPAVLPKPDPNLDPLAF